MNRTHVEPLPPDSTSFPKALPGKLGIKIHSPSIFYQLPLILHALVHVDLLNVAYLMARAFIVALFE